MPSALVDESHPACLIFLVDRSESMKHPLGSDPELTKANYLADCLNRLLNTFILTCEKGDRIRDLFYVAVIGYGRKVGSALSGKLAGQRLVSISQLANNILYMERRTRKVPHSEGGFTELTSEFPAWVEPMAAGTTPMGKALTLACTYAREFLADHPDSFPPTVLNITDGEANEDDDPEEPARKLRELKSSDGNVFLFNMHISSSTKAPIRFPTEEKDLPNRFAQRLFRMSSRLPPLALERAAEKKLNLKPESRGFIFNADATAIVDFFDISTRTAYPGKP